MGFQSSVETLIGAFIAFYIGCAMIGRPDIPIKVLTELRTKEVKGTNGSFGCPSAFAKNACNSYDSKRYR